MTSVTLEVIMIPTTPRTLAGTQKWAQIQHLKSPSKTDYCALPLGLPISGYVSSQGPLRTINLTWTNTAPSKCHLPSQPHTTPQSGAGTNKSCAHSLPTDRKRSSMQVIIEREKQIMMRVTQGLRARASDREALQGEVGTHQRAEGPQI